MNKIKSTRGRFSLTAIISSVLTVFGIGCVCWALVNIGSMSLRSVNAYLSNSPGSTISAETQNRLTDEDTDPAKPSSTLFSVNPNEGDYIGSLVIPVLQQELPIIEGTGDNELAKGVGHFLQSAMPGEEDNCVLSGHRDTVFSKLDRLEAGDQVIVQTVAGTCTYEIRNIRIVDKDDRTVIVPADKAILTLTTCYPFYYIGSAPERYILTADLISSK